MDPCPSGAPGLARLRPMGHRRGTGPRGPQWTPMAPSPESSIHGPETPNSSAAKIGYSIIQTFPGEDHLSREIPCSRADRLRKPPRLSWRRSAFCPVGPYTWWIAESGGHCNF